MDLLEQLFVQMNGRDDGGCEEKECLKGRRGNRVFIVCFRRYWCYRGTRAIHTLVVCGHAIHLSAYSSTVSTLARFRTAIYAQNDCSRALLLSILVYETIKGP